MHNIIYRLALPLSKQGDTARNFAIVEIFYFQLLN